MLKNSAFLAIACALFAASLPGCTNFLSPEGSSQLQFTPIKSTNNMSDNVTLACLPSSVVFSVSQLPGEYRALDPQGGKRNQFFAEMNDSNCTNYVLNASSAGVICEGENMSSDELESAKNSLANYSSVVFFGYFPASLEYYPDSISVDSDLPLVSAAVIKFETAAAASKILEVEFNHYMQFYGLPDFPEYDQSFHFDPENSLELGNERRICAFYNTHESIGIKYLYSFRRNNFVVIITVEDDDLSRPTAEDSARLREQANYYATLIDNNLGECAYE